jgi:catechol 2,3-dioxygenase-like lactoylglutathione lyase family enzyme
MSPHKFLSLALFGFGVSPLLAQSPAGNAPTPAHLSALYHVGFWVRDIEKSRAFYETYLGFAEPYVLNFPTGALQMVVIKINDGQSILLFPNPSKIQPNGDNLDHLGLVTDDAAALHDQLVAKGVKPSAVHPAHVGDLIFGIKDPDGHPYEVTQFEPDGQLVKHHGQSLPATRISPRLQTATIAVADLKASLGYYCDRLGFTEAWRRSTNDGTVDQVELRVPDGTSGIILQPYAAAPGAEPPRAVSEFCLEVPDVSKAIAILRARAAAGSFPWPNPITIGINGQRQTRCIDPDGTQVVLMEPER